MIEFEEKELQSIVDIIGRYQKVSADLLVYLDEAQKIQERVDNLKKSMNEIKSEEDKLMEDLHKKYGEFGIQDVYESLNQ